MFQGASLSGADSEEVRIAVEEGLKTKYTSCAKNVVVTCDTMGTIATACPNGMIEYFLSQFIYH